MAKPSKRSDALGVAIKMEQEGRKFYKQAAAASKNPLTKKMFLSLATDEQRHEKIFREMAEKAGMVPTAAKDLKGLALLQRAEEIFRGVARKAKSAAKTNADDIKALDIALDMEVQSYNYYTNAAKVLRDAREKEVLRKIADEENVHFRILNDARLYLTYPEMWFIIQEKPVIDGG
jgi:rubrerythrin